MTASLGLAGGASTRPAGPGVSSGPPVLVVTRDATLAAELHRLAAAAGAVLQVVADHADSRSWSTAPVVLVGADALGPLAAASTLRKGGVQVVAQGPLPDELFRAALEVGAEDVVELPAAETWLVEALTDVADGAAGRANVVCVVGGCGGAGATTFAAALAGVAASASTGQAGASDVRPVTLVDADPLGPGIEQVAGLDDVGGARWGSLLESAGRLGSRSLRAALPQRDGLAVLGWGPGARVGLEAPVVREVVSAAQRGSALVVVDLPRHPDAAALELLRRCDHLLLVTALTLPAVASAAQVAARMLPIVPQGHLVTRGSASVLDPDEIACALGMPVAAAMPDQRRLVEAVELGLGPIHARRGPLARAARAVLARVATPVAETGVTA
jgi:secretion/DNA translocation related CpaE-like protein